ncbi:unnamed protein product [Oikopleura dioica]|uniref:RING-type domain-containing protein n=1 Tax=Oikopleura dioica TaxID=34765 RepID=E4X7F1_OIKDI|nr:unnamed protein product [Oikopleura dioica]
MKEPVKSMNIHSRYVTDFGTRGKCFGCTHASGFTAEIKTTGKGSERYCKFCVTQKFPEAKAKYEKTDAKFSCPACLSKNESLRCNTKELTYDEYYVGSCCKNAGLWTYKTGKLFRQMTVQHIYEDARKDEDSAETAVENADAKVVEAKKVLENCEKTACEAAHVLDEKKKWRKTVQKRALFLANEAMKEDNSDLEDSDYEPEDGESEAAEEADEEHEFLLEKMSCKVCMEKFDDEHPEATIIPCGHKSCFHCLSSLPNKACPTCRAEFTMENVYKLY